MKDSFVLYNSFYEPLKSLTDEQLGKLFRAIFDYTIEGKITQENEIKVAFLFIKNQLDIDIAKWNDIKAKRSEAGKNHKGNQYSNQDGTNGTSVPTLEQNGTNGTVNVNVNVNDNVIKEKDNNKLLSKKKSFQPPTSEEVHNYCKERNNGINAQSFIDFYESKGWMIGKNKMKDWKAAIRTWEKNRNSKQEAVPAWLSRKNEEEKEIDDETRKLIAEIEGT